MFIELPESGHLINVGHIVMVEHEMEGELCIAVIHFVNSLRTLRGKDAIALVERLQALALFQKMAMR
jgi:hypothetical protein